MENCIGAAKAARDFHEAAGAVRVVASRRGWPGVINSPLGFNPTLINYQLQIINNLKNEFKKNNFLKKIDNIDLTDPNKPKIKVFKP